MCLASPSPSLIYSLIYFIRNMLMAISSKFILTIKAYMRVVDRRSIFPHCMIRVEILIDSIIMVMKELLSNGETDIHFSGLFHIILRGLYRKQKLTSSLSNQSR